MPKATVQLAGGINHHLDRSRDTGNSKQQGLCVYVHKEWWSNLRIIHRHYFRKFGCS